MCLRTPALLATTLAIASLVDVPVFHYGKASTACEGGYSWFWGLSVPHGAIVADTPNPDASCFAVVFSGYRGCLKSIEMLYRNPVDGTMRPIADARLDG